MADAETRYSKVEQIALALRSAAQRLCPYFQAHPIIILTDQPLRSILHKPNLSKRMLQWAIELSKYGIKYQPRLSMKGQVMIDFVVESPQQPFRGGESDKTKWWTLQVDRASRSSRSEVGLLLQSPTGEQLEQVIRLGSPYQTMKPSTKSFCLDWTLHSHYSSLSSESTTILNLL